MIARELLARMTRLVDEAGITETPQHGEFADYQPRHMWEIVCQSVRTTAEIEAALPEARRQHLDVMGVRGDDRPDEITFRVASWKQTPHGPDPLASWIAAACKKVPAGYVPVRIMKGSTVKASIMGPAELRSLRESVGYSIEDLARKLSVSRSIVQKWEAGTAPIPAGVATSVEALQDAYADAVEAAVKTGGATIRVPRTDEESWESTGRPARWHRQIAAEVRLEHGTRIEWTR